ncbi:MAG: LEA type 2 family protein [Gemmatimonadales bacterium]|nr:LEA type 2 family protein [Gemmatimonadales bacterium]
MTRWLRARLLLGLGALGCAGLPGLPENPDIQLSRVVVRGLGVTGGNLDLVLDVRNPNQFDLRGTRLVAGFEVEDTHVGDVTYDNPYTVPRDGVTDVTLPLRFTWSGVGAAFRSLLGAGDIPYTMKGQATLTAVGTTINVPFTRRGRAPISRVRVSPIP